MGAQIFKNNAQSALVASITDSDTSLLIPLADAAMFPQPFATGKVFVATLGEGDGSEIVVCHTTATVGSNHRCDIYRAQEGTTAQSWDSGTLFRMLLTAGTMDRVPVTRRYSAARGDYSVDIVPAIGNDTAGATGNSAVAIGLDTAATGDASTAVGSGADALAIGAVAVGLNATVRSTAEYAVALGTGVAQAPGVFQSGGLSVAWNTPQSWGAGYIFQFNGTQEVVVLSDEINLKTTQSISEPLPTGVTFWPDEVGVIITEASGVSGQPSLRFGDGTTMDKYLATTATSGMSAAKDRHRFTSLASAAGADEMSVDVITAATGTTLKGRIYWRGFAVVNEGVT